MVKKNASDVARHVRRSIEHGEFRRLDRLPPSRQLAESLGVARNTLRDALQRLEREGLLETRPGSGTYVVAQSLETPPSAVEDASPLELIDARFALEPHICRLVVLHGRREDFEALEKLCVKMEASHDDPIAFAEADAEFHWALAQATRNNLLIWLIAQINTVRSLAEWTRMRHITLESEIIAQYNVLHREIFDAICARESERAAQAMKAHLETARLSLLRALET